VGAPDGPGRSRTNVVPRPGSSTGLPGGSQGSDVMAGCGARTAHRTLRGRRDSAPERAVAGLVGLLGRVPGVDLERTQPEMSFSPLGIYLLRARSAEFSVQGFSVPARDHRPRPAVVSAVRALLPRRRRTSGRAWDRGGPRHRVPVGAALHTAVGRRSEPCRHTVGDRWLVDETDVKAAGRRCRPAAHQLTHFGLELVVAAA
jgi:hypothetical protein